MTFDQAKEIARRAELHRHNTVYATSDGHFFINPDPQKVLNHSLDQGLEIYSIKGPDLKETEDVKPSKRSK